jgi:hypothetical protein
MSAGVRRWVASVLFSAGALVASQAFAAPQILALLETSEPVALHCADGSCRASFSTLCLQKERDAPQPGTVYVPASADSLILDVTSEDGRVTRLPAAGIARIVAERNYASVAIVLSEAEIAFLEPVHVALTVGPLAALVPMPALGDSWPLTREEIARVTGSTRLSAELALRTADRDTVAARATQRLINAVAAADPRDAEAAFNLGRNVLATAPEGRDHPGVQRARAVAETCRWWSADPSTGAYLRCLQGRHDDLMFGLNARVWHRSDIGS